MKSFHLQAKIKTVPVFYLVKPSELTKLKGTLDDDFRKVIYLMGLGQKAMNIVFVSLNPFYAVAFSIKCKTLYFWHLKELCDVTETFI